MPARRKLDQARLQQAALALVDRDGLAALSMRSLARELGIGTMTLYGYVADRDGLDALVVEAVMEAVHLPAPRGDWRDHVRDLATAAWVAVSAHPNAIPLILNGRVRQAATRSHAEALLAALARGGLAGESLLAAFRAVNGYIMGAAQTHAADLHDAADPAGAGSRIAAALALPDAAFPRLREIAQAAAGLTPDRQFAAGLGIILAGIPPGRDGQAGQTDPQA